MNRTDILSQVFELCMPNGKANLLHITLNSISCLIWPDFTDEVYPL
jgi:hypothetical protein